MALRSVVVEAPPSPPPSRRTVVLRAGAPAPRGRLVDLVVGVLGALLLLIAVVLVVVLPDKTYVDPQFRLSFVEGSGEGKGTQESPQLAPGASYEFAVDVPQDNVKTVTLKVGFNDDVWYSLPDIVKVELFAPNGTLVGTIDPLQNPPPKGPVNATDSPTRYAAYTDQTFHGWADHQEQIIDGLSHSETPEQAQARLEKDPAYFVPNHGTWKVRVTLTAAQGCPDPTTESWRNQALYCRTGHPNDEGYPQQNEGKAQQDGSDPGNAVKLFNFEWTYYIVSVEELK